jgi:hypothetical protein
MQYFIKLVELLPLILPCESCRKHTAVYLKTTPIDTENPRLWLRNFRTFVRENNAPIRSRGNMIEVAVIIFIIALLLVIIKNALL